MDHVCRLSRCCHTYTFDDSREPGLLEITFVVSRDVATHTRSMTLENPSCWRSRSTILEISRSHSCSLFLVMFSHWALVTPAIVMACRCLVYSTGGPPPEIVSYAGTLYLWRHIAFCHYFCQCMVAERCIAVHVHVHVQVHVHVVCRCSAGAGACAVRVQLHGNVWSVCVYEIYFFSSSFFSPICFFFSSSFFSSFFYTCLLHR